jgi:dipeptidyl aminopeptidase/acylaminoacyl peptidase
MRRALAMLSALTVAFATALVPTTSAGPDVFAVQTLASVPGRVDSFAQSSTSLAWFATRTDRASSRVGCTALVLQSLRTGARRAIGGGWPCATESLRDRLLLLGDRVYWETYFGGRSESSLELYTASPESQRIRMLASQTIFASTFDRLVSPASDGRSVYFVESEVDLSPRLLRFDGVTRRHIPGEARSLTALAAGRGRVAAAKAVRTYDCAQDPSWSPDGSRIAFASGPNRLDHFAEATCREGVWVMGADGSRPHRIAADGRDPDWSRDGSKIAYERRDGRIVVSNADGADPRMLVADGEDPAWSPDGARIAFTRGYAIFVVGVDGRGERLIASAARQPDWSPDGNRLVYVRGSSTSLGLGVVNADGTGSGTLTNGADHDPSWSPDGRRIAFAHCAVWRRSCPNDATQLSVVAPDGSARVDAALNSDKAFDLAPSWSPDSSRVAFARSDYWEHEGDSHIAVRSVPFGPEPRGLTTTPVPRTPIVVRSRDGRELARHEPNGVVAALAVTRSTVAALVRRQGRSRLELYSPWRRTLAFAGVPAPELSASGTTIVLRIGRTIVAVDARTGSRRTLARAAAVPVGLSIVGRRVGWAENLGLSAGIHAVTCAG